MMPSPFLSYSVSEIIDRACMQGLLKYDAQKQLVHAPFSLNPFPISKKIFHTLKDLTPLFNRLMLHVAQNPRFLRHHLEKTARADPFVKQLLDLMPSESTQEIQVLINRNDYFPVSEEDGAMCLKQVELNTMAASFAHLSQCVTALHQELYADVSEVHLIENHPLQSMGAAIAHAIKAYDAPASQMLMVVQTHENNRFDQLGLMDHLLKKHGIRTLRLSLEEVGAQGKIKAGHLEISGKIIPLTYFRAGYIPEDMKNPDAITGRSLIEHSSSIKIPDIPMQLAGLKKIQQVLSSKNILQSFISDSETQKVHKIFVPLYALEDCKQENKVRIKEWAIQNPENLILKPQREGGGHNIFASDIKAVLQNLDASEAEAYILMEQIHPLSHEASLVIKGHAKTQQCVSEIGGYGVAFFDGNDFCINEYAGSLVRTKSSNENEGGVCAGYACLNSLALEGS